MQRHCITSWARIGSSATSLGRAFFWNSCSRQPRLLNDRTVRRPRQALKRRLRCDKSALRAASERVTLAKTALLNARQTKNPDETL